MKLVIFLFLLFSSPGFASEDSLFGREKVLQFKSKVSFYKEATLPFVYYRDSVMVPYKQVTRIKNSEVVCNLGANDLGKKSRGIPAYSDSQKQIVYEAYEIERNTSSETDGVTLYFAMKGISKADQVREGYFIGCSWPKTQKPLTNAEVERILGGLVEFQSGADSQVGQKDSLPQHSIETDSTAARKNPVLPVKTQTPSGSSSESL